uniref:Elongin-C n=1 Tax=Anolis carolinensis TaxID=28377 RepID=A0A803T5E5_ANOCA
MCHIGECTFSIIHACELESCYASNNNSIVQQLSCRCKDFLTFKRSVRSTASSNNLHLFFVISVRGRCTGTIKAMLSGPGQFAENETNKENFREIPSHVLSKICMYFTYKVRYTNSSTEIPEFPIALEIDCFIGQDC